MGVEVEGARRFQASVAARIGTVDPGRYDGGSPRPYPPFRGWSPEQIVFSDLYAVGG